MKSSKIEAPVPKNYTCYRCGQPGHWIKNCPSSLPPYSRVKRCTGIPRTFLVKVNGPEHKGALLMSSGDYAVPLINHLAYKEAKDEEPPPIVVQDEPVPEPEAKVPDEVICKDPDPVQSIPEQPSQQADNRSDSYYHEKDYSYGYERGQMTDTGSHIISYFDKSSCDSINSSSAVYHSPPEHENNYHSAAISPPFSSLLSTLQVFSAQPPPPGISPFVTSHVIKSPPKQIQSPPPPAAPFIPFLTDSDAFVPHPLESRDLLKDASMPTEKSIDDQMEELQRRLEHIQRNSRENGSRNQRLGMEGRLSSSPSRSRFYSTSKSRTPSPNRISSRSYHARSIDDQMKEFQRRLEEIHRKSRENDSRNRSRGVESHQSRSSSRAQLYSTSKSRTPSPTHSSSRSYSARSIDDRMEEFQRRLQKIHRNSRESDSRNRSVERHLSRSSSRTQLYSTSKSRTPSPTCSSSRPYRARSRTPLSSRSRSRSRSWSKKRSYTRSECHARTDSRSRTETSNRRRGNGSRDRVRSPNSRSRSRSYSPKAYRVPSHSNKHGYTYSSEESYHSRHLHSVPSADMHSRPGEQYPYGDRYLGSKYPHQRYEREKYDHSVSRYEERSEYKRHQEKIPYDVTGYDGERSKDYKPRNRQTRDPQRKQI